MIRTEVKFRDIIYEFWEGRGMGNSSHESKMLQNITEMREEVIYKVFLDLRKAYGALNTERCMDILMVYGVCPQTERILQYYWDHLSMVARAGCYYGTPFKGHQGVTPGDTISTTIFNIVTEAVIHSWVIMVEGEEAGPTGSEREIQWMEEFFHANDGLITSPSMECIKVALYVLAGFFVRVVLQANVEKYFRMVKFSVGNRRRRIRGG